MKWLKFILLAGLILYLILTAIVYTLQRQFLYFPPSLYLTPQAVGLDGFEEITLNIEAGNKVTAFWSPPADENDKVVMFFHGNGSAVFSNHDIYRDIADQGIGVLGVGYPGYPGSSGTPNQPAIERASEIQREFLIDKGIEPDRLVYFGTSLGSGVASQLAENHPPALLILDAPFNSILDMGRRQLPFLPVKLLMKDQYRSDEAIKNLNVPMIWTHGTADKVVPITQGQKLYDGYNGPKSAHIIEGGQHTNLWGLGGKTIVLNALQN